MSKRRKVLSTLKKAGFEVRRKKGSHFRLVHPDGRKTTLVLHPGTVPKGTLRAIINQAGLTTEEFITTALRRIPQASTPGDEPQVPRSGTSKAGVKSRPPAKEAVGLPKETPSLRAGGGFISLSTKKKKKL